MKIKKISLSLLIVFILHICLFSTADAAEVNGNFISSQGACVMDYETGEVLYEYCGYTNRSPASMTKVMSLYCIFREIERQNISLDTVVPISNYVYSMPSTTDYQCIPLYATSSYTVDQLIGAVATYSASNALMALVEFVAGTETEFVNLMNKTADEMGLGAFYYDSCGGHTNYVSPVAMAMLARNIIRDFPQIIERTSKRYITFNGANYYSTNKLYTTYSYDGIDGLKTGTSRSAGYCLCATGVRNGRRIITVTMGSSSNYYRFNDSINLLNYGFNELDSRYSDILCYTDTITQLNGYEIPTLMYVKNELNLPVVDVERLKEYGFDISFDDVENIMTVSVNPDKKIIPVQGDVYHGISGNKFADVSDKGDFNLVVDNGAGEYEIENVFFSNGKYYISVMDLGSKFSFTQNDSDSVISVDYYNNFEEVKKRSVLNTVIIDINKKESICVSDNSLNTVVINDNTLSNIHISENN